MMRREKKHTSERVVLMLKQRDNSEGGERRKESARAQGFTNAEEASVAGARREREKAKTGEGGEAGSCCTLQAWGGRCQRLV